MVETGFFPDVLKISKVIPIYKKCDVSLLSNYRPICLLPTLSKIFERVIYNQLYNYFVDNSLLTEHQFGFRAKHSEVATIRLVFEMGCNSVLCHMIIGIPQEAQCGLRLPLEPSPD